MQEIQSILTNAYSSFSHFAIDQQVLHMWKKNLSEQIEPNSLLLECLPTSLGLERSLDVPSGPPIMKFISNRNGLISKEKKLKIVNTFINDLAIKIGHSDDAITTLSGGNQQRVVLAKWLASNPKLLICSH